jgi:hypothetical protein
MTNWWYRRQYRLKPLCFTQRKQRFFTIGLDNNFVSSFMPSVTVASYQPLCPWNGLQEVFITISNQSGDQIKGFRGSYLAPHYSSLQHGDHPNGPSEGGGGETNWAGIIALGGPLPLGHRGMVLSAQYPLPPLLRWSPQRPSRWRYRYLVPHHRYRYSAQIWAPRSTHCTPRPPRKALDISR